MENNKKLVKILSIVVSLLLLILAVNIFSLFLIKTWINDAVDDAFSQLDIEVIE